MDYHSAALFDVLEVLVLTLILTLVPTLVLTLAMTLPHFRSRGRV